MIRVQAEPFDPAAELALLLAKAPGAGAAVSFVGLVRDVSAEHAVTALELEQYPGFTLRTLETIGRDACARFELAGLNIVHRYGRLAPAEPIVFVAAAAAHRRAAFDAVAYLMDRLKTEAPFWKREHGPGGSRWIEPRACDIADRQRWDGEERAGAGD